MREYTISEIHSLMEKGELNAEMLVKQYLERIEKVDKNGPGLNSIIELNPDAIEIAKDLDNKYKKAGKVGILHGIPVLIKDNLDTADKMKTTAGSFVIEKYGGTPKQDSFVVKRLREAGAIILGKTNLSEMANFRGQRSVSGWSSRGGTTKNPYFLDRNPSGSSSGSGVSVAANLCTVAIGTETDGSIISPASTNGVVGIKPSVGLVSRSGIVPIAHTQDTAGPMARTVQDATILLEAIVGYDEQDVSTKQIQFVETNYTSELQKNGLKGAKIGIIRKNFGFHKDVDKTLNQAIEILKNQGAIVVDDVEFEYPKDWENQEFAVLLYEYKYGLNNYFPTRENSEINSIEDLIKYNKKHEETTMPYFGQEHVIAASEKGDLEEEEYVNSIEKYDVYRRNFNEMLQKYDIEAVIAPSNGPAWVTDLVNGDSYGGGSSQFAAVSGFCNITVPAGFVHGLPVGLNFISSKFKEKIIIKLAYAFEQASQMRTSPDFKKTIN